MKSMLLLLILIISSLYGCQSPRNQAYLAEVSSLPSFGIQLTDSSTVFYSRDISMGYPTLIFYFSPDCPHCRKELKSLVADPGKWTSLHIYMLSRASLTEIRKYETEFQLDKYPNLVIGKDYQYSFTRIYRPTALPFITMYDSKKALVKIYHGEVPVDKLIAPGKS